MAVKHHNKINLSELENEIDYLTADKEEKECIMRICHLIRDADKVQNLEHLLFDYAHYSIPESENLSREAKSVSEACLDCVRKKTIMKHTLAQTKAERLLYHFSWIFDLHFESTKNLLRQIRFRERYAEILMKL